MQLTIIVQLADAGLSDADKFALEDAIFDALKDYTVEKVEVRD